MVCIDPPSASPALRRRRGTVVAGQRRAQAADKVTLRTNWLFYGSHSIFVLGIDKGFYEKEGIDLDGQAGQRLGSTPSGWSPTATATSPMARRSTMINLAAQGAPLISVATIDAHGHRRRPGATRIPASRRSRTSRARRC